MSGSEPADPPVLSAEAAGAAEGRGRLRGRRVLVVGAGTRASDDPDAPVGNGRAISVLAAREGATVACADRVEGAARATVDIISAEGGRAVVVVGNVVVPDACAQIVDEAVSAMGGLDGLVLNVGTGEGMTLEGTTPEAWDLTFAVNLRAHFLVARSALPRMEPGGAVVFISSVAGLKPGSQLPAYDASKAGLFGLSRHVALEGAAATFARTSSCLASSTRRWVVSRQRGGRRGPGPAFPSAARERRGKSRTPRSFCCRRRRATSRARAWSSTAE